MARDTARSMRSAGGRDWREHWLGILRNNPNNEFLRRFALEALANLGYPQRTPGEDDE